MDNANKAIMIGVGLFITVLVITAVIVIVNLGTGMLNNAANEMGGVLDELTHPKNWEGKTNISAATVNGLLAKSRAGTFKYPVVVYDGTATVATGSNTGSSYNVIGSTATAISELSALNPVYARVGTVFYELGTATDDGNTAADGTYNAYVIQSRANSNIGVLFVKQ